MSVFRLATKRVLIARVLFTMIVAEIRLAIMGLFLQLVVIGNLAAKVAEAEPNIEIVFVLPKVNPKAVLPNLALQVIEKWRRGRYRGQKNCNFD